MLILRSCCDAGMAWNASGSSCLDSSPKTLFDDFLDHPAFLNLTSEANLTEANFEKASPGVKCPEGYILTTEVLREGRALTSSYNS